MEKASAFIKTMKKRFRGEDTYDQFRTILRDFKVGKIDTISLTEKIEKLFKGQKDLIVGFNRFLPKEYTIKISSQKASKSVVFNDFSKGCGKTEHIHEDFQQVCENPSEERFAMESAAIKFIIRIRKNSKNGQIFKQFLGAMKSYKKSKNFACLEKKVSGFFKDSPELYVEFTTFLADAIGKKPASAIAKRQPASKKLDHKTSSSANSLKQKLLIRYEDDMYDQDMIFHRVKSTMEAVGRLIKACEENPSETIHVGDYLSAINLKCIERLYEESGCAVVSRLQTYPYTQSVDILLYLEKKFDQLKQRRDEVHKARAKAIKNLHGKA